MKKLFLTLALASIVSTANALPPAGYVVNHHNNHVSYDAGYKKGKSDAYHNVGRTLFFTGCAIIAGVMIYELGKESRWTANKDGVVYRF